MRHYLVIRTDRTVRVAKKPRLAWDEVAVAVDIEFPDEWGTVVGGVSIELPPFNPTVETTGDVVTVQGGEP